MSFSTQLSQLSARRRRLNYSKIECVAVTTSSYASGTLTFPISIPVKAKVGDLLVIVTAARGGSLGGTTINDKLWTRIATSNTNATSPSLEIQCWIRPYQNGDPTSFTITPTTSRGVKIAMFAFSGVNLAEPVASSRASSVNSAGVSTNNVIWPNASTIRENSVIVGAAALATTTLTATAPDTATEILAPSNAGGSATVYAWMMPWGSGPTNSPTAVVPGKGTQGYSVASLALTPAVSSHQIVNVL